MPARFRFFHIGIFFFYECTPFCLVAWLIHMKVRTSSYEAQSTTAFAPSFFVYALPTRLLSRKWFSDVHSNIWYQVVVGGRRDSRVLASAKGGLTADDRCGIIKRSYSDLVNSSAMFLGIRWSDESTAFLCLHAFARLPSGFMLRRSWIWRPNDDSPSHEGAPFLTWIQWSACAPDHSWLTPGLHRQFQFKVLSLHSNSALKCWRGALALGKSPLHARNREEEGFDARSRSTSPSRLLSPRGFLHRSPGAVGCMSARSSSPVSSNARCQRQPSVVTHPKTHGRWIFVCTSTATNGSCTDV